MTIDRPVNILLIEDESYDVNRIKRTLEPFSDKINIKNVFSDGQSSLDHLSQNPNDYDVIIMDYQIMGPISGKELIKEIKAIDPFIQIIVITKMTINVTDLDFANNLIEAGAMWFCTKYPSDIKDYIYQPTDLLLSILNAFEKRCLNIEKSKSKTQLSQNIDNKLKKKAIIGSSEAVTSLRKKIERAAKQDVTVLVSGASGTGKELVATHIHYLSKRKYDNFVSVNAGSIPTDLMESELFGFARGSFTGATTAKKGLFELAHNGSIFLDEIGELSMAAQVKLLRVLQEGEIDKIGRTETVKVDARVIAATNVNLEKAVEDKKFREDLFYRLNVINIEVPTLSERIDDIPELTDHFINMYSKQMSLEIPEVSEDVINMFKAYEWPGNIRQLQNIIQRLLISTEEIITPDDVKRVMGNKKIGEISGPKFWFGNEVREWKDMENIFRTEYFNFVRSKSESESEAARKLGIAPSNFNRMCTKLGIK